MIVLPVYIEPTDPVIELLPQARQSSGWHPEQRLDLVRGQLKSELETGTGRVPKEIPPKTAVRQQATERAFHVSLTHASFPHARIAPTSFLGLRGSLVQRRTSMCESTHERGGANHPETIGVKS
jgi:hypothetical protein